MKLNRKWLLAIALVLSMTMAIGGTLAYLTDRDTVENVFTMGNVDIEVEEVFPDGNIKPGETVNKDAKITNEGSNPAWVWMTVSVPEGLKDYVTMNWADGFAPTSNSPVVENGQAVWTVLVEEQLPAGGETDYILDSVTLSGYVDYQGGKYVVVQNGEVTDLEGIVNGQMVVTVTGYATQAEGLGTVAEAYSAYQGQWGEGNENPDAGNGVDEGIVSGIRWTLTDTGRLTVSPSTETTKDANSGKEFAPGVWREAVVYNSNGGAVAEGYNRPNATADEGGYFCDRNAVTSLVIEEGVTSIGSFAAQFPNLTGEVVIPASVTYIGQEAFQKTKITKLTFAAGGTEKLCIAPGAFKSLDIEELVLPADRPAIDIHCWAFNDCTKLERVTFPDNISTFSKWTHVDYMGNMDYVQNNDSQILARCSSLKSITFGSKAVRDLFFNAAYNTNNINAIGNVEIIIEN